MKRSPTLIHRPRPSRARSFAPAAATLAIALGLLCLAASQAAVITVTNMAALKLVDTRAMAQGDAALMQSYHYGADDRGGGWFVWNPSSAMKDDAGRYIQPTNSLGQAQPGRWVRILKGETANVKMWGAWGDNVHDNTAALQAASDSLSTNNNPVAWALELLLPASNYRTGKTWHIPAQLHLRGEGPSLGDANTCILCTNDVNVIQTWNLDDALDDYPDALLNYDHDLLIENMGIIITPTGATNGACIAVFEPGEASELRNMFLEGGGYGVRCFGGGAPGLKCKGVSWFYPAVAGCSLEAYLPDGTYVFGGGACVLTGCSGDAGAFSTNACWFRAVGYYGGVTITDFKAERQWGGGLIRYSLATNMISQDVTGYLRVHGGTYNTEGSTMPCDLVVLDNPNHLRTVSLELGPVMEYGVRHLINDLVTGRTVEPDSDYLTQCRQPVLYESVMAGSQPLSRLIVGGTALVQFVPQAPGWYRVFGNEVRAAAFGGRLAISSCHNDCAELSVQAGTASPDVEMNVLRTSKAVYGFPPPMVTQARAGSYFDTNNNANAYVGFLDLYVANLYANTPHNALTIAHPIDGMVSVDTGSVQLLWPTNVLDANYSNSCTLVGCLTTNLTR